MPGETRAFTFSAVANGDLSTHQYKFVKLGASGLDVTGAGEAMVGVLQNDPTSGNAGAVMQLGISQLVVNGNSVNIAAGDPLESSSNGIGIKSTADKKNVGGYAMEAATADGVVISVLLVRYQSSL